jgi:hypothetical protein
MTFGRAGPKEALATGRYGYDYLGVARKRSRLMAVAVAITLGGCSLFHHRDSSQQQFLSALKRGDAPGAGRIWLNMDAEDRADLSHGVGIKPQTSPAEIQAQLLRHQKEKAAEESGESADKFGASLPPDIDQGDINSQVIEMPGLDIDTDAGALQNLPNMPAAAEPAPTLPEH